MKTCWERTDSAQKPALHGRDAMAEVDPPDALLQEHDALGEQRQSADQLNDELRIDDSQRERTVREMVLDLVYLSLALGLLLGAVYLRLGRGE